jgi:Zn-dependent protease
MIDFFIGFVIFLFILSVHEYAHAWMADRCGDPTARLQGRMTLNPASHIDPLGTILIPLSPFIFGALSGGGTFLGGFRFFGWARPVPVNPLNVRRWRLDNALISFAGPASGFIIAFAAAFILRGMTWVYPYTPGAARSIIEILFRVGTVSIWLSLFNLIPIPPLDGFHVVTHLVRVDVTKSAAFLYSVGPFLLLFLINTPILYAVLTPLNMFFFNGIFRAIAGI